MGEEEPQEERAERHSPLDVTQHLEGIAKSQTTLNMLCCWDPQSRFVKQYITTSILQ